MEIKIMEKWIEERINKLKRDIEKYENTNIPDHTLEWISSMLESAWFHGRQEGSDEAYENVAKWRNESK